MNYYHNFLNFKTRITGIKAVSEKWDNIGLISIHIPKTAGTSFIHTLKEQYGRNMVVRIDITSVKGTRVNKIEVEKAFVSRNPRVVHGHFTIEELRNQFMLRSNIPVITWFRDPVERVISNYYYLSKRLSEELDEKKKNLNILSKMKKSLIEYAGMEQNRNRMSKFLKGLELEDLFFIGLVENYQEDLVQLGKMLGWDPVKSVNHNATGVRHKTEVPSEIRHQIANLNEIDISIYQKAQEIRNNNR